MKVSVVASLLLGGCLAGSVTAQTAVSTGAKSLGGDPASKPLPAKKGPAVPSPKFFSTPLAFEANDGQTDKRVKFLSRGHGYTLFLTDHDAVFAFRSSPADAKRQAISHEPAPSPEEESSFRMSFVGANSAPQVSGAEKLEAQSNYLIGNDPKQWHTHVTNYAKVLYTDLYPGISALYYGNERKLEYDFKVQPGASVERISLTLDGATDLHLENSGDLAFHCGTREVAIQRPTIYQISDAGARMEVAGSWALKSDHTLGFSVPTYDHSRELVIDPTLTFDFATYLGGSSTDYGFGIAANHTDGSIYVTGTTMSPNLPDTTGELQAHNLSATGGSAFVSKFDISGNLKWSTYLGGATDAQSAFEPGETIATFGYGIAVNSAGNAFVTGTTNAHGSFPTSPSAETGCGSSITATNCSNVFVVELNPSGTAEVFGEYIPGNSGNAITLDSSGDAYIAGNTYNAGTFAGAPQSTFTGSLDAFVAEVLPTGSLSWWTYLGGSGISGASGIAVDNAGNAYVTGSTQSSGTFPTMNPLQSAFGGGNSDAFVAELSNSGGQLHIVYSTYLGGSGLDSGQGIAVDPATGAAFVTGYTQSANFPTVKALQSTFGGSVDVFVAQIAPNGASLVYSTYLGGSGSDDGNGIAVDANDNAYVIGQMDSAATSVSVNGVTPGSPNEIGSIDPNVLNLSTNAIQPQCGTVGQFGGETAANCANGFVTEINPAGNQILFFTYIGGSGDDYANGIALDTSQNCISLLAPSNAPSNWPYGPPCIDIAGTTGSSDFPRTNTTYAQSGTTDAFVAQVPALGVPDCVPVLNQVGLSVTVTINCTAHFTAGSGTVNVLTGSATLTNGSGPDPTGSIQPGSAGQVTVVYSTPAVVKLSAGMTDSAGTGLTSSVAFPVVPVGPVAVSVMPTTASVLPSGTVQLTATITNATDTGVKTWKVDTVANGSSGVGTIAFAPDSSTATYTAPAAAAVTGIQTHTIVALSNADGQTTNNPGLTVTVYPTLVLSPSSTVTATAGVAPTTYTVSTTPSQSVSWTLTGTGCGGNPCGSISTPGPSTSVVYTVPATLPSNAQITDVLAATTPTGQPSQTAMVSFVVNPGTVNVSISPSTAQTVVATQSGTITYTANVTGTSNTAVTWKLTGSGCNNNPCGSLNTTTGVYTPPTAVLTNALANTTGVVDTVTATSQVNTAIAASDQITIYNPASVSFSPPAPSVAAGTAAFTVTEQLLPYDPNQNVTWQLTGTGCSGAPCGKISTTGPSTSTVYTPPAALSASITDTLVATPVAGVAKAGSLPIVVTLPTATFTAFAPTAPPAEIASQTTPIQFSATISGPSNTTVLWSVTGTGCGGAACGSISSSGLYAIPSTARATTVSGIATDTVIATSQANTTQTDSAQVTIYNPATVALNPSTTSVQAGSSAIPVTATLSPAVPGQSLNVTWQLSGTGCSGAPCGAISSPGPSTSTTYTPPTGLPSTTSITDKLTATSVAEPTQSGQSVITVTPLTVSISISPTSQTVVASQSKPIQFSAPVTGPSNTAVTWALSGTGCSGAPCGTLSATGLYTPPSAPITTPGAVDTVKATSVADPTKSASAPVTINNPVSISISPAGIGGQFSIEVGGTPQVFTPAVTGSTNTGVVWALTGTGCSGHPCGTITQSGSYTPPAALSSTQTDTIVATAMADSTKTATIKAVIFLPPTASSPPSVTVAPGGTATYAVTLNGGTGDPLYGETLSCFNLPNGANCIFTPSPLPAGGTSFSVQVTTTSTGVSALHKGNSAMLAGLVPLIGLFMFGLRGIEFRKRLLRYLPVVVLSIFIASGLIACGTSGTFATPQQSNLLATPPGTFSITVMGTSNVPAGQIQPAATAVTTLPLTVN